MKNHLRKLMAVTCALVMLLSCMAVAGVSAAAQAYTWTFSSTENNASYWSTSNSPNNSQGSDYFTTPTSGTGYNGSDRYIRMAYASNVTSSPQYSVMSLPNNTGSAVDGRNPGQTAHLLAGVTYKVTVAYKVISAPVDAQLVMSVGLGDLQNMWDDTTAVFAANNFCGTLATIAAGEVSEDWVVKTAAVTVPQKQGVYVALAPNDNASRNGLELHLGYVAVEEAPAATGVTFVYNDNETSNTTTSGVPGLTALPTPTSSLGWTFQGWYDNADCTGDAVTAWPAAATTLYAKWDKSTATEVFYTVAEFTRVEYTQGNGVQYVRATNMGGTGNWFGARMYPSGNTAILTYEGANNPVANAGFRVLSDTSESFGGDGKDMLVPNAAYRVEFDYQTTAVASVSMQLRAVVGDVHWCADTITGFAEQSYYYKNYIANNPDLVYDVATIDTVMDAPAHADFLIRTGAADNYFSLVLPYVANCTGVSVTIDNVKFTRVAAVNVTFDGNDGADTVVEDKKAVAGSALPTPTHVRGYDFLGWYADADCTGDAVTVWPDASTTLYAKWDKSTPIYKVTYDPMAGSLVGDAVQYGAAGTALTATAKLDGYKFEGWTNADGNPLTAIGEADITVYARFKQVEYVPHTEGVQDFEGMKIDDFIWATNTDAADLTVDRTANYTKGGTTALHATIRPFGHGQRTRPRIVLQEEGRNVVVKAGDKVTVSFWIKSSRDVSGLTFYLATMDATTAAEHIYVSAGGTGAGVCHNLQTINTLNGSTSFANTNGKEPKEQSLKAGEWTQFTAVINSITADSATDTTDASIDNYLELGFADDAGDAGFKEVDLWVDDIIVLVNDEEAPVPAVSYEKNAGMITFEDETVGSNYGFVNGSFTATVSNDISHAGGTNSLKITQTGADSGANRAYVPITADNVVAGKQYLVSFWLYVENDHKGLQLRYWLAPNGGSAFANGGAKDAVKIAEGVAVSGYVGNWVRTTVLTNAVKADTENVLYLGIFDAAIANGYSGTSVFYLDDISVADPTTLTQASIEGNVAVYKNQENSSYFYEEGKAAMRYVAGYKTTRMDCNNIILDGVDYNLNERGLIFGTTDMSMIKGGNEEGAGVEGTDYLKWVFKNENLSTCWSRNADGTVQYSFYVKGVNAANHATQFNFRSYVSIAVQVPNAANTATVNSKLVIYGNIVTASYDQMFAAAAPTDANPFG